MHLEHDCGCGGTHPHEHDHPHHPAHGGQEPSPRQQAAALLRYMVGHNESHAAELAALAQTLRELGDEAAGAQILEAVAEFEKGNRRLSDALASMQDAQR